MNKLEFVKAGAEIIVSIGVGAIVGNAVVQTTPANTKKIMRLCIKAGSLALSGIAGDKAAAYVTDAIDSTVEKAKDWMEKNTPEQENEEIEAT